MADSNTSREPFDEPMVAEGTVQGKPVTGRLAKSANADDAPPLPRHPAPHQGYRYASIALTAIAGLMSIASIITAAFSIYVVEVEPSRGEGDSVTAGVIELLQALTIAESALCMIAMATCFGLLFTRPHAVLIRNPHNGSFVCLCVSVFLLFIFSAYSFAVILGFSTNEDRSPPRAMSVAPAVRLVALISFFAVLVANSKVLPHDRLL